MSDNTRIDWAQATINPLGWGCYGPSGTPEKPNRCPWCYAHRMAKRNLRDCPQCRAFVPHWHPEEIIEKPAHWRKPRRIFVQSMGDLFGLSVPDEHIITTIAYAEQHSTWVQGHEHTFIFLTKEPARMRDMVKKMFSQTQPICRDRLWFGASVTNQADANERIPLLLETPAAVRWVSVEPMLGEVNLSPFLHPFVSYFPTDLRVNYRPALDWVVIGAQTGPDAVSPKREWIESVVEQCKAAGVPVFLKANLAKVWGEPLIQQYPEREAEG